MFFSVDLLLVPFVVFLALGLQVLNALESHQPKVRIVYVCFISRLSLASFRRLDWHADERPPAEIATLYQHTKCVYLRNTNIQQMIRWMCGVSMKNRKTSKELRELVGVETYHNCH